MLRGWKEPGGRTRAGAGRYLGAVGHLGALFFPYHAVTVRFSWGTLVRKEELGVLVSLMDVSLP